MTTGTKEAKNVLAEYLEHKDPIPAIPDMEKFISTTSNMTKLVRCWEKLNSNPGSIHNSNSLIKRSVEQRMQEVLRDVSDVMRKLPNCFLEVARGNLILPFTAFSLREQFAAKAEAVYQKF